MSASDRCFIVQMETEEKMVKPAALAFDSSGLSARVILTDRAAGSPNRNVMLQCDHPTVAVTSRILLLRTILDPLYNSVYYSGQLHRLK